MKILAVFTLCLFLTPLAAAREKPAGASVADPTLRAGADQKPYLDLLRVNEAWEICRGDPACLIGIVDTGFDFFHPALHERLQPGYFAPGVYHTTTFDLIAHGTAVASLMVADRTDPESMVGFAPDCRAITAAIGMPEHRLVRLQREFFSSHPEATMSDFQKEMMKHAAELKDFGRNWIDYVTRTTAEGIRYLVDHGARVINISAYLGKDILQQYPDLSRRLDEAFDHARENDVVMVIGAGNNAKEVSDYPGEPETVLVVGASTLADERWEQEIEHQGLTLMQGSSFGPRLSVMAPMDDIPAAAPHDASFYTVKDGPMGGTEAQFKGLYETHPFGATSMATPIAAALAALVRSLRPELSAREVVQIIQRGARDLGEAGPDAETGHGRVDFLKTLQLARDWTHDRPKQ